MRFTHRNYGRKRSMRQARKRLTEEIVVAEAEKIQGVLATEYKMRVIIELVNQMLDEIAASVGERPQRRPVIAGVLDPVLAYTEQRVVGLRAQFRPFIEPV